MTQVKALSSWALKFNVRVQLQPEELPNGLAFKNTSIESFDDQCQLRDA